MKWLRNVIKSFFSWWNFFVDADRKRDEWYRQEIINALDRKDFERANFLEAEWKRPLRGSLDGR